jgi:hypothetical protein
MSRQLLSRSGRLPHRLTISAFSHFHSGLLNLYNLALDEVLISYSTLLKMGGDFLGLGVPNMSTDSRGMV